MPIPPCVYCGEPATDWDHVIPQAVHALFPASFNIVVPSCHECNCIAGYHLFTTLGGRRKHIQTGLKKKYRKILVGPKWSEEEIKEMSWTLQIMIQERQVLIETIRRRIAYIADDTLILGGIGNVIALRNAANNIRQKIKKL